ncbi:hypothetical protein V6Z12_D06G178000 [Gossypium hirsutum]
MCWLLWKNWNKLVFSNFHSSSQEIIDNGINWARNYVRTSYHVLQYSPMVTVAHWSTSSRGWIKLNTDGAISPNGSYVRIGGMDSQETIVEGGAADSQIMELRGIHQMVCRGWKVCFHHVLRIHNDVVDHMAKVMATRVTKIQVFEVPPHSVWDLVQTNCFRFTRANEPIH